MIQLGTMLKVADKTGMVLVQCIKVLGYSKKKAAFIGDMVLVSVKWINPRRFAFLKERKQKRYALGTMHRALLIRSKFNFVRLSGFFIKFNENAVVIVNRRGAPYSRRIAGPLLLEFCERRP
jgi:large subunit ribosomal protein L14